MKTNIGVWLLTGWFAVSAANAAVYTEPDRLDDKLSLARFLLQQQPAAENWKGTIPFDYELSTRSDLGFTLRNERGETVSVYLQPGSKRIFFVEFYEPEIRREELQRYLSEKLKYVWVGSGHGCEFLNDGLLALNLCPDGEKGTRININLMLR